MAHTGRCAADIGALCDLALAARLICAAQEMPALYRGTATTGRAQATLMHFSIEVFCSEMIYSHIRARLLLAKACRLHGFNCNKLLRIAFWVRML